MNESNLFWIYRQLPSLNEYIEQCRRNKYAGANFKTKIENAICADIRAALEQGILRPVGEKACELAITYFEKTRKRDVDNIQSANKFILDAMRKEHIIINDSQKYVKQVHCLIDYSDNDHVLVEIKEHKKK
jgi:Holliday junction resolvase RusA-like endonuclease